jgi:2-hydroxy-3-oxopropionate reductase
MSALGFIGLGTMGAPMAGHLLRGGHRLFLNIALTSARNLGVPLPNTATAQELFSACVAEGGKAWDHSAMVRALEKMAGFEVGERAGAAS